MPKFRKKPIVVEALQFHMPKVRPERLLYTGDYDQHPWVGWEDFGSSQQHPYVRTLNGRVPIEDGEWIIEGVKGEFYPCKPDVFEATYEVVEE